MKWSQKAADTSSEEVHCLGVDLATNLGRDSQFASE